MEPMEINRITFVNTIRTNNQGIKAHLNFIEKLLRIRKKTE